MITAVVVAVLVVYLVERSRPLVLRWLGGLEGRTKSAKGVELPHDLLMLANSEGEEWAKEQTAQRLRELFTELGSWEAVRGYVTPAGNGSASRH